MSKIANLVIGPAGVGKSTFCKTMLDECLRRGRNVHCVNFDPAAESLPYAVTIDIKNYITSDLFMDYEGLGPNGALVAAMEHFFKEYEEVLEEEIEDYSDDYLWIDCPGQIELYVHLDFLENMIKLLQDKLQYKLSIVFVLDATYSFEPNKFVAGVFSCLSVMAKASTVPCIALVTKMDLYKQLCKEKKKDEDNIEYFLDCDPGYLYGKLEKSSNKKFESLMKTLLGMINDEDMISFFSLDITDTNSIFKILYQVDLVTEYMENQEPDASNLNEEENNE